MWIVKSLQGGGIRVMKQEYKLVPLSKDKFTIIDLEDFEKVKGFKWYFSSRGYATSSQWRCFPKNHANQYTLHMHRVIMNTPEGLLTDHINGDSLDNRKSNLRIVTNAQNLCNVKLTKKNTSGYKGVSWCKNSKHWRAKITFERKIFWLGGHKCPQEAAKAYDKAALKYFGEYAKTNEMLGLLTQPTQSVDKE